MKHFYEVIQELKEGAMCRPVVHSCRPWGINEVAK